MKKKEAWCAMIGGVVGAVLTLVVCSFSPLGAQIPSDGNFNKITCTELEVVRPDRTSAALIFANENGGFIIVIGADGKLAAGIGVGTHGGTVDVYGKNTEARATMGVNKHGGILGVYSKNADARASMDVNEHGGRVGVFGSNSCESRAAITINEYGNGAVSTWDKNGYRLK